MILKVKFVALKLFCQSLKISKDPQSKMHSIQQLLYYLNLCRHSFICLCTDFLYLFSDGKFPYILKLCFSSSGSGRGPRGGGGGGGGGGGNY